jgi:hypothetical protein
MRSSRARPGRAGRARGVLGLVALAALLVTARRAAATEAELGAAMECRVEAGTGRLLCTVALEPPAGKTLSWSDAVVVSAPPSARPLRSRVASSAGHPERIVIGFVLGSGEGGRIEVVARAVSCPVSPRAGACTPSRRTVGYELELPSPTG